MIRTIIAAMAIIVVLALTVADVRADEAKTTDAAKTEAAKTDAPAAKPAAPVPAADTPTVCTVKDVQRSVMWKVGRENEPQAMKVGDKLPLGADICTGLRSTCRLIFNDDACIVDVKPMTVVRIAEFSMDGDKVRTRVFLKQGTVQADVEPTRFKSDFAVVSPEATLAVRGTHGVHASRHQDTGFTGQLLGGGLLYASNNQTGRGQYVRPGDKVAGNMNPAIQVLHNSQLVRTYDTHGGNTPGEVISMNKGAQMFGGPGHMFGPGGNNGMGGFARNFSVGQHGSANFFLNHPNRLPNYVPPVQPVPVTPKHSSGGSCEE
ncbi:MAG: FecR domain-containing protein [Planctomycetes bacterium]|nr:FecR domain-containing protein [Planctomycetota bacterium]